ncbi:MAG: aliphatic sulfonate ABC transporter substrate-binding protein [Bradyrhizobiaceae bacterium]|nr:MAG: aliphatic sulfonate ABC transporter substrate-binding protein [Bradyrhizobiaceae bacterium]
MKRRQFLKFSLGAGAAAVWTTTSRAQTVPLKEIRIGYQKNGVLVIAREQRVLENHFNPLGIEVRWLEFSSGPPMLEAVGVGSVDYGAVGDSPPIFAQAAGAAIVYAAGQPITNGQGILVPKDSAIRSIADLKGKRVAFTKGSSAHGVIVLALEKAGLSYGDITPVYLSPPDGGAAFANGSVDAWAVWDPYFSIGEVKQHGRILANASDITKTNAFFIANRNFAKDHGEVLHQINSVIADAARWAESHRDDVARSLSAVTGVALDIQTIAANRSSFAIGPVTDDIIATQQALADRYYKIGLIPKPIVVRDAVWKPNQA